MEQEQVLEMIDKLNEVKKEIKKEIIGQEEVIEQVLIALLSDGNVLLESVPGLGKTQLVKTVASVLALKFSRIQFTPDLMPADITGTNFIIQRGKEYGFEFQKGPIFANLILADEINRATPKTQSALLEAMQEKTVTASHVTYQLEEPFLVLATQNPIENEGTYPLPEAQLDRFLLKIKIDFPEKEDLKKIVKVTTENTKTQIKSIVDGKTLLEMRTIISQMPIADAVMDYAISLIVGTQPEHKEGTEVAKRYIAYGAGVRGAQALIKTAKARAFLKGRFNVAFEDLEVMVYPVLRHRLILNFEAMSEGLREEQILTMLLHEKKPV